MDRLDFRPQLILPSISPLISSLSGQLIKVLFNFQIRVYFQVSLMGLILTLFCWGVCPHCFHFLKLALL